MGENFSVLRAEAATDSITLYWERPQGRVGTTYEIYFKDANHTEADFAFVGSTQKTHYTIENLQANTQYKILVKGIYQVDMALTEDESESVQIEKKIKQQTITVHTFNRSVVIDITKTPYNAVGDGKILNTKAIQSAIDDCPKDGCVMIPSGTFMTGALRLHSDMELYLAKGAVLQGTANPEDYLPRIWSRFEGTEMECYSSLLNIGALDPNGNHRADYESAFACKNVAIWKRNDCKRRPRVSRAYHRFRDRKSKRLSGIAWR